MAVGKSPGPDDLSIEFYKKHWDKISHDIFEAFQYIFATGDVPPILNATTLSLIPKVVHPSNIRDYRPISCCNNIYKAITKILMSEMSSFMPELQKAYDMVEWESLWTGMFEMGFPQRFVFMLQSCITRANFSINLNGTLRGWFASSKGLRHVDPISSYLFVLVLDIFNGLMRKASGDPEFKFHPKCQQLEITHLSFADDMILLTSADIGSFKVIKKTLAMFVYLTGLRLNCAKSKIFFGSTPEDTKVALCEFMGMSEEELPMKYLGMPLSSKGLTNDDYRALFDKICNKINTWQMRHLSLGGRVELIRSSIFGIQIFWCISIPLPKYVVKEVEKRVKRFLWIGKGEGPYMAKVSWDTAYLPLMEGGLGFKDMFDWNQVWVFRLMEMSSTIGSYPLFMIELSLGEE
ncbi:reverse transcriptase [Lithospermum erythrorhizon]|uniref:Reverse transcriptase n=1 Tax=Lithospermum erythrorhizon TaxID=34254 RepID=A0AAV3QF21_LITER